MLFHSYLFILLFLPIVVVLFHTVFARKGPQMALAWLAAASVFFYAYWSTDYLWLLACSLCLNFTWGRLLMNQSHPQRRQRWLGLAIGLNLALLAYYKYANFFIDNYQALTGEHWIVAQIILPLGISFFTFEQIAYLVDASRGRATSYTFLEYAFFVLFFPHLIAGPIIKHDELLIQVRQPGFTTFSWSHLHHGAMWFIIGLFKKVIIADNIALYASPMFAALAQHQVPTTSAAWLGLFAYSLQLYFDFSGYSDMAVGLANLVNLKLPINFNSPYQAVSPIDFWRRWHMTLSRFLKDHLYIPLGGNRSGVGRKHVALLTTMLLGGFWHGAGWGFLIWGGLNGLLLSSNHLWRSLGPSPTDRATWMRPITTSLQITATFVAIMWTRIFFRTGNLSEAGMLIQALLGQQTHLATFHPQELSQGVWMCLAAYAWCRWAPNTQQWLAYQQAVASSPSIPTRWHLPVTPRTAMLMGVMLAMALLHFNQLSEFLYFQF